LAHRPVNRFDLVKYGPGLFDPEKFPPPEFIAGQSKPVCSRRCRAWRLDLPRFPILPFDPNPPIASSTVKIPLCAYR
jgi:hypothetical protein